MIDINVWLKDFIKSLEETFADRVWFVGLQGSYGRGEATETSDIDVVVILDEVSTVDVKKYGLMLDTMPNRELICGFFSGKKELLCWEASDLFQFYHDTNPIKGSLDELLIRIDDESVDRAINLSLCNIYHGCVHNMLHEKSKDILKELYKSASFVVQAIVYRQTGKYIKYHKDLADIASSQEKCIVESFTDMKNGQPVDFDKMSQSLFEWAKCRIEKRGM